MVSTFDDRVDGISTSTALKAPCRVATTAAIVLSGLQTIDGVTVAAGDRVLVKDQNDTTKNGIYVASSTAWARAEDFDGNRDVVTGTRVYISSGTALSGYEAMVTTTDPVVIGTSVITFALLDAADPSSSIRWQFSDETAMADPGSGLVRFNDAAVESVTSIAIDPVSINSGDVTGYLDTWGSSTSSPKGSLTIRKGGAFGVYAIFDITSVNVSSGWYELTSSYVAGSGSFSDGDDLFVSFLPTGNAGLDGTGDVTGPASAVNNALAQFDGTSGTLIKSGPSLGVSANNIPQLDSNGKVVSAVLALEINPQTGTTYTTVGGENTDAGKLVTLTNSSAISLTIPPNSIVPYPIGTAIAFQQGGAGTVTMGPGSGVTLENRNGLVSGGQYAMWSIVKKATDTWAVTGDLTS